MISEISGFFLKYSWSHPQGTEQDRNCVTRGWHGVCLDVQVLSPVYGGAISMEPKGEGPRRAVSQCWTLLVVLPGQTARSQWTEERPSASGAQDSKCGTDTYTGNLILYYKLVLQLTVLKDFFVIFGLNYAELCCNKHFLLFLSLVLTPPAVCNALVINVVLSCGKPGPVSEMQ